MEGTYWIFHKLSAHLKLICETIFVYPSVPVFVSGTFVSTQPQYDCGGSEIEQFESVETRTWLLAAVASNSSIPSTEK